MVAKSLVRWFGFLVVFASAFLLYRTSLAQLNSPSGELNLAASATPTPTEMSWANSIYLPLANNRALGPDLVLDSVWTEDLQGNLQQAFLINDQARLVALVNNGTGRNVTARLRWTQYGPCGDRVLFDEQVNLDRGEQRLTLTITVPDCLGYHIMSAELSALDKTLVDSALLVANPPSQVGIDQHHGFDRCNPPTASQMQKWWTDSPYWVINLYIGGISLACNPFNLTPDWLNSVAQQGWTFIPTWVGPQAPCTGFRYRMSSNPTRAYQEGRAEANAAVSAARELGFLADMVIYYDIEGYPNDASCRATVSSFVKGWVERLHEVGLKAGVYGSACLSYIADWAGISPVPDDVWIAHWAYSGYNANATVGDVPVNIPCLGDDLWPPDYHQPGNHQRIKQYAGDHTEAWGGVSITIDSNVLDGQVTVIQPPGALARTTAAGELDLGGPQASLHQMGLLTGQAGWVLAGNRLLATRDSGRSWLDITPANGQSARLLAATFSDLEKGWVVLDSSSGQGTASLEILITSDGGRSWEPSSVDLSTGPALVPIGEATLEFLDDRIGWLALDVQSGSSFSLGRLFATLDGGRTWQERSLPLGEPVRFQDASRGWVAGGPSQDQLFRTTDGGLTWTAQPLPQAEPGLPGPALVSLPVFRTATQGLLAVTQTGLDPRLLVYATQDGGNTWTPIEKIDLSQEPGSPLAFSAFAGDFSGQGWAAGTPDGGGMWVSSGAAQQATVVNSRGLPQGLVSLEFLDNQTGWAVVQEGSCQGQKLPPGGVNAPGGAPFRCESRSRLFRTADGGLTWLEITPQIPG